MEKIPILNKIIKNKRKKLNLTQPELAKLINKHTVTVNRYENGSIIPYDTLILICEKLNLDLFELLLEQLKENEKNTINFYDDVIIAEGVHYNERIFDKIYPMETEVILSTLEYYYNFIFKFNLEKLFSCEYKNNKFYVKEKNKIDPVLVLTTEQAQKLIYELQTFFDFQLYKINSEKNNNQ